MEKRVTARRGRGNRWILLARLVVVICFFVFFLDQTPNTATVLFSKYLETFSVEIES